MCSKKKQKKEEEVQQTDVNPVYEGAADYDYDDMGNCANMKNYSIDEVSSTHKKQVKAEVINRNSIYGESEEGWENAVVVDNNQYYEC